MTTPERPWLCPREETCPTNTHDTTAAFRRGCRSGAASRDHARENKLQRLGRRAPRVVDSTGTIRRLKALAVIGWSSQALADELGVGWRRINQLRGTRAMVTSRNARRVTALYDRLSMTPGGDERAAADARRKGWAGPLCFDDIDDPQERPKWGEKVPGLGRPDPTATRERVAHLIRSGKASREIADDLGMHRRSVERIRSALRDEEAA